MIVCVTEFFNVVPIRCSVLGNLPPCMHDSGHSNQGFMWGGWHWDSPPLPEFDDIIQHNCIIAESGVSCP